MSDEMPIDVGQVAAQFGESLQAASQLRVSAKQTAVKP
jgi:hypothetical protein